MTSLLTEDQLAKLDRYRDEFRAHCLSTDPVDRAKAESIIDDVYAAGGLAPPATKIWAQSPLAGVKIAANIKNDESTRYKIYNPAWSTAYNQIDPNVWSIISERTKSIDNSRFYLNIREGLGVVPDEFWPKLPVAIPGSHWAGWMAPFAFLHNETDMACAEPMLPLVELTKNCGWLWAYKDCVIMTERPTEMHLDENSNLHCENAHAIQYPDGWGVCVWHGTVFPDEWLDTMPTPEQALALTNIEQRRVACEMIGWVHILETLNVTVIDQHPLDRIGALIEVHLPDNGPQRFVKALCGTGRTFAMAVPNRMQTALEAQAWMHPPLTEQQILAMEVRT